MLTLRSIVSEFQGKYAGTEYARECYRTPEQRIILDAAAAIEELMTVHVPAIAGLCERAVTPTKVPEDPNQCKEYDDYSEFRFAIQNLHVRCSDAGGRHAFEAFCLNLKAFGGMAGVLADLIWNFEDGDPDPHLVEFHSQYVQMVRDQNSLEAPATSSSPRVW